MHLRHFLFDFDGTLADSAPLHAAAFREVLATAAPGVLAGFDYELLKGLTTRAAFMRLGIEAGARLEWCVAEKQKLYREAVRAGRLKEYSGARVLLEAVVVGGGANYLVTSGSADSVNLALNGLELRILFAGIITADDTSAGKPSPEPYIICLRRFGLRLAEAIAVEDARSGVVAAKTAGLRVIGVHNPEIATLVDIYYPTLTALSAALLQSGQRLLVN
jgi:HAD superfamily hydrolase (TIGR01509 family)